MKRDLSSGKIVLGRRSRQSQWHVCISIESIESSCIANYDTRVNVLCVHIVVGQGSSGLRRVTNFKKGVSFLFQLVSFYIFDHIFPRFCKRFLIRLASFAFVMSSCHDVQGN